MKGAVVLPNVLFESGFTLDKHIFRYRRDSDINKNIDGIDILVSSIVEEIQGGSIWHSSVGALNDPFEIYAKINPHEFKLMSEAQRINIWATLSAKSKKHLGVMAYSQEQAFKLYCADKPDLQQTLDNTIENSNAFQDLISSVRGSIGIACFTSVCDSRLMWGYYCNGFSGVCLIYNREKLFDNKVPLECVDYQDTPFEVDIINFVYNLNRQQQLNVLNQIVKTKHSEWSHEIESRSVIDLHAHEKGKGRLLKIEKRCIEGVIIGRNVRTDVRRKIEGLCKILELKCFYADVDYQVFGVKIT
ncbi:DUF2971 domain-containing protein [Kluyvera ascorbata]|uniref:DUF2971 domain-containing protein n=1 Tax=Kluyvera ascorbata TaxID=51288 RepID=UPI0034D59A70